MNSFDFITAFGHIDEDIVHEAIEFTQLDDEKNKELVSTINNEKANTCVDGRKKKRLGRTLLIAAVVAALFSMAAYATGFFGLKALLIPGSQGGMPDMVQNSDSSMSFVDNPDSAKMSFTIPYDGPESFMDWAERCLTVRAEVTEKLDEMSSDFYEQYPELKRCDDHGWGTYIPDAEHDTYIYEFGPNDRIEISPDEYEAHMDFLERRNTAKEAYSASFAAQHGLAVLDDASGNLMNSQPSDEIIDAVNREVCHADFFQGTPYAFDKFCWYPNGSFLMGVDVEAPDGTLLYCYLCNNSFNEYVSDGIGHWLNDVNAFTTREYTAADGTELIICQSDEEAILYAYLDNSYLVAAVNGDTWNDHTTLTDEVVNYVADFFHYSSIGK